MNGLPVTVRLLDPPLHEFLPKSNREISEVANVVGTNVKEDESRIEMEVRRHNSEEEIDHGPVLRSLRAARAKEQEAEEAAKK